MRKGKKKFVHEFNFSACSNKSQGIERLTNCHIFFSFLIDINPHLNSSQKKTRKKKLKGDDSKHYSCCVVKDPSKRFPLYVDMNIKKKQWKIQ